MINCPDECKNHPKPAALSFERSNIFSFTTAFIFVLTVQVEQAPPTINEIQVNIVIAVQFK